MKRMYVAVIEARGKEMSRSKPMLYGLAMLWISQQKKQYSLILRGNNWCSYLLTMSQPDDKLEREKSESEYEKNLNKYL
jgi:hypothetical protein